MFEWLEARGGRWSQPSWPLAWGRKLADTDHGLSHVPSCSCRWHLRLLDTGYSAITLGVWYWTGIYIAFSQTASLFLEICLLSLLLTARAHTRRDKERGVRLKLRSDTFMTKDIAKGLRIHLSTLWFMLRADRFYFRYPVNIGRVIRFYSA